MGGLVSNTGTWLQAVAASVFVYQLTDSVFMVGVLNFVSFLPIVLFSIYGGSLADRRDRRRIVIVDERRRQRSSRSRWACSRWPERAEVPSSSSSAS